MHEDLSRAFSLEGQVAVITGGASGIGLETGRVFARAGARVMLADIDAAGLTAALAEMSAAGSGARATRVDVAQRAEVDALADEALRALGRLDIWVNCAGIVLYKQVLEASEADVERMLAINVKGTYWGCAAAGRAFKAQGRGVILNVSSTGADSCGPGLSLYSLSKSAVNALTRTCAREFGQFGVRVNAVAPGWVDTPLANTRFHNAAGDIDPQLRERGLEERAKASPLGITGTPRDIALAMLYLASDAGRFVTGQVIRSNGGVSMP
jgi:3-oxoacyl-[acyl-carrier protein] reductase